MRRSLLLLAMVQACRCGPEAPVLVLEVDPKTVDFGDVAPGSFTTKDFSLRSPNESVTVSVAVDSSFGAASGFVPVQLGPIMLEKGKLTLVSWRFAPPTGTPAGTRSARVVMTAAETGAEVFLVGRVIGSSAGGGSAGGGGSSGGAAGGSTGGGSSGGGGAAGGSTGGGSSGGGGAAGGLTGGGSSGGGATGGGTSGGATGGGTAGGGATGGGGTGGGGTGGGTSGGASGGGAATCSTSCTSWTQCTTPGTGCDTSRGCCVPCGGLNQPCCVDFSAGQFNCGTGMVCGRSTGSGGTVGYYCCTNAGDGCCQQGGCSGSTCCKCPRNGLNFCVQPSFGCGGC